MTSYFKVLVNCSHVFVSGVLGHEYAGFAKREGFQQVLNWGELHSAKLARGHAPPPLTPEKIF